MKVSYDIMHMDRRVARIAPNGKCAIYYPKFMPCNLYLEEGGDVDTQINNLNNFYYWCATRVLTLDRQYAKEILGSVGMSQATTDRDRAKVSLSYYCLSLTDVHWAKPANEKRTFGEVNLYQNHLDKSFVDIALRGRQYTVQNEYLSRDLSTSGCYPKAWQRSGDGFVLLKDGGDEAVDRELIASQICRCFRVDQVLYDEAFFEGQRVTASRNMTSLDYAIVPIEALSIYTDNREMDLQKYILRIDKYNYHMMNIMDYLVGNTDRHWGNWGVLKKNKNNSTLRLHDLMDFNQAFHAYDTLDGGNCQTIFDGSKMNQRQAAEKAVLSVGLNQIQAIDPGVFARRPAYREMCFARLALLRQIDGERKQAQQK